MTKAVILIPTSAEANLAAALDAAKTTGAVVFNAVEDVKAAQALIANNQKDVLLEKIVADFQALNANLVIVKGVQPSSQAPFANSLNFAIAQTLDAQIILVANNEEGTLVEAGEVDGLVSGAVHTTANTIRPPMQIIKTAPGSSIISSVFFMLLPDQVLVYGDCAVNPEPTAEQLAEIAIQSAESAKAFGLNPKVAMLSYSTGTSGSGQSVEKVKEATRIALEKRPDLLIDGPLQYDAAVMKDVAASKAPNSKVAGQANVFVFPDINAGNIGYKAVQRSADLVAVGPMLQGMRKPVNDLSRGALVDDIIYTIALTAIQATQA